MLQSRIPVFLSTASIFSVLFFTLLTPMRSLVLCQVQSLNRSGFADRDLTLTRVGRVTVLTHPCRQAR